MEQYTSYKCKIKHYNHIFKDTVKLYTDAVRFFLDVILENWNMISICTTSKKAYNLVESLTIKTKQNPNPVYDFHTRFYKFPCYLRRAAIACAYGKASSYHSNLANWMAKPEGKKPSVPVITMEMPAMYKGNTFIQTGDYTARVKVFIRNTWDWLDIELNKGDMDYLKRRCSHRTAYTPTIQKIGKQWFLRFAYSEEIKLNKTPIQDQTALSVDLGLNHACVCTVMQTDGTILGRHFFKASAEQDRLSTALNRIKKAQRHGAHKTPRLWAKAKGINKDITNKTAQFIMDIAVLYNVDVIVFEHLNLNGKKHGSKKQRLHMWKAKDVQNVVTIKAHRICIRISHVCARNTSRLAYDGSGYVQRGTYLQNGEIKYNYGICIFQNGKQYNCDLNASYNIGARYFIRELLKSLPETARLAAQAQVPELAKRSTCTRSSLISLCAVLSA